jgi:hypothetical protein
MPKHGLPAPLLGGSNQKKNKGRGGEQEASGGCCSCVISLLCIFLLHQAWTGESDGWKCVHTNAASDSTLRDDVNATLPVSSEARPGSHEQGQDAKLTTNDTAVPASNYAAIQTTYDDDGGPTGKCELRKGQPSGYEASCLNAKTPAACADLVDNCVWNPASRSPAVTDDHGAGHKLTHTVKWAMVFQTGLAWVPLLLLLTRTNSPAASGLIACVFVIGFVYSWVEMITVVFGHTGDVCADASGPDAGHITRLLWWSKAVLWIQISMLGCSCCVACSVAMMMDNE